MVCRHKKKSLVVNKNEIVQLENNCFGFMQLENFENVELTNDYVLEQVLMLDV